MSTESPQFWTPSDGNNYECKVTKLQTPEELESFVANGKYSVIINTSCDYVRFESVQLLHILFPSISNFMRSRGFNRPEIHTAIYVHETKHDESIAIYCGAEQVKHIEECDLEELTTELDKLLEK
ncbi:hypothetical protein GGI21_006225 [Coemansia aciculifera]|nr:hypothetical protein GGI21_006225 [Coemansia aciculifera]